jgi:hypothetical protein
MEAMKELKRYIVQQLKRSWSEAVSIRYAVRADRHLSSSLAVILE